MVNYRVARVARSACHVSSAPSSCGCTWHGRGIQECRFPEYNGPMMCIALPCAHSLQQWCTEKRVTSTAWAAGDRSVCDCSHQHTRIKLELNNRHYQVQDINWIAISYNQVSSTAALSSALPLHEQTPVSNQTCPCTRCVVSCSSFCLHMFLLAHVSACT